MSESHLDRLKTRHRHLDLLIKEETANPDPDRLKIQELKKRKLILKEQIDDIARRGP